MAASYGSQASALSQASATADHSRSVKTWPDGMDGLIRRSALVLGPTAAASRSRSKRQRSGAGLVGRLGSDRGDPAEAQLGVVPWPYVETMACRF